MFDPRSTHSCGPLRAVLALALALAAPGTAAASTDIYHYRISGPSVSGFTNTWDGCIETGTQLSASSVNKGETWATYYHYAYNYCIGEGTSVYGSATPTTFTVAGNLSSAHLVADIGLSHNTTMAIDETFAAVGPAATRKYSSSFTAPDYRYSYRSLARTRAAVGTGTISLESGSIQMATSGTFQLTHL
ncbi:hypothetical protein ACVBEQ_06970 [Nakamurella sp. GG22]